MFEGTVRLTLWRSWGHSVPKTSFCESTFNRIARCESRTARGLSFILGPCISLLYTTISGQRDTTQDLAPDSRAVSGGRVSCSHASHEIEVHVN
jgi:hypothetical protein